MSAKDSQTISVTFSNKTVVRVVVFVVVALLLVGFFSRISSALKLIMIASFLAMALNPAVSWISSHLSSKSRIRATAVTYLCVISLVIGFIALVGPPLARQTVTFVNTIPLSVDDIQNQDTPIVHFIQRNNLTNEYSKIISEVKDNLSNVTGKAYSIVATIGSGLIAIITVMVMTFMMLVEGPKWIEKFIAFQPKSKVEKRVLVLSDMYRMVTSYVSGQLLIATIAATFAFFALVISSTIFGANINPVALAAIVGLIGLIPMIGNTIAAVIVVLFCLFSSAPLAIVMAIFFIVYQQVENATLQPYIQSRYNELTPLTVFISAIIGVSIAGFLGALIAIPIAGCLRIYFKAYYEPKISANLNKTD